MDDNQYKESPETRELKSQIAGEKPRDEEGHFIHKETPPLGSPEQDAKDGHLNPISKFLHDETAIHKGNDDELVDIHVGNPLHKIVQLLQDIKKQKAFSFILKGSLGIAGVALALGMFGIFGAGNLLCEKGVQSEIGVIRTLNVMEEEPATIPVLSNIIDYFAPRAQHNSTVLIKKDESVISLPYSRKVYFAQFNNLSVIATGNYNSCSQKLTIKDPTALEIYANR